MVLLRIKSMNDDVVSVVQTRGGHEFAYSDIKTSDLLPKYRLHKSKVTELLKGWHATENPCSPLQSTVWQHDMAKSRVSLGMSMVYGKYEEHVAYLELLQDPMGVKVLCEYPKGTLHLPAGTMRIDRKESKSSIAVGLGMHITSQYSSPLDKHGNDNTSKWVSPFWLVAKSTEELPPNMQMRHEKVEVVGEHVYIPVLTNSCALKRGDLLLWNGKVPPVGKGEKRKPATKPEPAKKKAK